MDKRRQRAAGQKKARRGPVGTMATETFREVGMSEEEVVDDGTELEVPPVSPLVARLRLRVDEITEELRRNRPGTNRYFELLGEKNAFNESLMLVGLLTKE